MCPGPGLEPAGRLLRARGPGQALLLAATQMCFFPAASRGEPRPGNLLSAWTPSPLIAAGLPGLEHSGDPKLPCAGLWGLSPPSPAAFPLPSERRMPSKLLFLFFCHRSAMAAPCPSLYPRAVPGFLPLQGSAAVWLLAPPGLPCWQPELPRFQHRQGSDLQSPNSNCLNPQMSPSSPPAPWRIWEFKHPHSVAPWYKWGANSKDVLRRRGW